MTDQLSKRIDDVQGAIAKERDQLREEFDEVRVDVAGIRDEVRAIADALHSLETTLKGGRSNPQQQDSDDAKSDGPAAKASMRPKKKLEPINYIPEDKPAEYRVWLERASEYQDYYGLSDAEAVKDLLWASNSIVKFRIKAERKSNPRITFKELCEALLRRSLPQDMEIVQYRKLQKVAQEDGESGESYVRRFELAMAEYLWYSPQHCPEDLYKAFVAKMNLKYTDRMREATSSIGLLGQIADANERLWHAFSLMKSISLTQTGERSFAELSRTRQGHKTRVPVNEVRATPTRPEQATATNTQPQQSQRQKSQQQQEGSRDWRCRPCRTDEHEWTTCEAGLASAFCHRCKKRGHPTFMHRAMTEGTSGADGSPRAGTGSTGTAANQQ